MQPAIMAIKNTDKISVFFMFKICLVNDLKSFLPIALMENEFGEIYTEQEVKEINDRILKLPDRLIDELFYRCGFIYMPHTMKALNDDVLEEIRNDEKTVEFSLLAETHKIEVLENLNKIEKEAKSPKKSCS